MLSTMREKTKVIMIVLAVAFVGWLVFDVGMGVTGRAQTQSRDVGSVNGTPIPYQTYIDTYRAVYEQARQQNPGVNFSREEVRELEDQTFNQLVQAALLKEEYRRHNIIVTEREIVDAVRRLPPPEITQAPDFQTNGQFDPAKYERFLSSSNANTRQYLLAMEARYAEELPRYKLLQEVTSDIYIPDGKLWTVWKDTHDSLTTRILVIRPEMVGDSGPAATDADLRRYYDAHKSEFRRPARAQFSFIAVSKRLTPQDSVMLVARVRALHDSILKGADFAALARSESADTVSANQGGSVGTFGRGQMDPAFERAAFALPVGRLSEPVFSSFGIHLIKVDSRTADSVTARHILVPYARIGARLDTLEARADSLDRFAAEQTDRTALDSAAHHMGLSLEKGPLLYQGIPYVLGRFRVPDVSVWAFEARPGETSPVVENAGAYYVFRLDSLWAAGVPPLDDVRDEVRVAAAREQKHAAAERRAGEAARLLATGQTIDQVAAALGLSATTLGPFTRTSSVPILGTATAAVGSAFRLRVGERSGLMSNDQAFFFLQPERRSQPDSTAWAAQKDQQRAQIIRAARQLRVQAYMESLRRSAKVKDRRAEVMRPAARADS
jgi:peptidyl-prolyl cis-trans isomerase D